MKLLISIYLACHGALASSVLIYDATTTRAYRVAKERLINKHEIPEKLIEVIKVEKCPDVVRSRNKLVLCANKKGLDVLNTNPLIIESLSVFKSEVE